MRVRRGFPHFPRHRVVLAVDIENSTMHNNSAKLRQRRVMYHLFEDALAAAGITRRYRDPFVDRGDGILALLHPADHLPKTLLLADVLPRLGAALAHGPIRLRSVVHAGEVHYDRDGCFGESLDLAFRLLDAPEVKAGLRAVTAPLVVVVSEDIHRSVVRQGYPGIDPDAFRPAVKVSVGGCQYRGWIQQLGPEPGGAVLASRRLSVA